MGTESLKHVKLSGGLGNQFFQYLFGCYLEARYSCRVAYFAEPSANISAFKIHRFVPPLRLSTAAELSRVHYHFTHQTAYRIARKARLLLPALFPGSIVENGSRYQTRSMLQVSVFDGYWQSHRYLLPFALQKLRDSVLKAKLLHGKSLAFEMPGAVFVHIRRGDYLDAKNAKLFAPCELRYFERAAARIKEQVSEPHFFVFSNDIGWAESHFRLTDCPVTYVHHEGKDADLADLQAMSRCQHGIISNSTFSWWAAQFIANPAKIIIAPQAWYRDAAMNKAAEELIPPAWQRL